MCLTINNKIHVEKDSNGKPIPFVAEEALYVVKSMLCYVSRNGKERAPDNLDEWYSPYLFKLQKINERLPKVNLEFIEEYNGWKYVGNDVDKGYHGLVNVRWPIIGPKKDTIMQKWRIAEKINVDKFTAMDIYPTYELKVAIVPKGTKYFLGIFGDIVAETMIITDVPVYALMSEQDAKDTIFRSPSISEKIQIEIERVLTEQWDMVASDLIGWTYSGNEDTKRSYLLDLIRKTDKEGIKKKLEELALV